MAIDVRVLPALGQLGEDDEPRETQTDLQRTMDRAFQDFLRSFPPRARANVGMLLSLVQRMRPMAQLILDGRFDSADKAIASRFLDYERRLVERRDGTGGLPRLGEYGKPEGWLYDQVRRDAGLVFSRAKNVRTQANAASAEALTDFVRNLGEGVRNVTSGITGAVSSTFTVLKVVPWVVLALGGLWAWSKLRPRRES
jgi:hypothetical protein